MRPEEADAFDDRILRSLCLGTIHELFEADRADALDACVFNGFVRLTGQRDETMKQACILSLTASGARCG
jgi:restriction system protein